MIWSTKGQHTHNTSKCTEFDGGSEFSQQMMIWSTKSQHTHNTSKCTEFDGGSKLSQKILIWSTKGEQRSTNVDLHIMHQNVKNLTADSRL